MAYFRKRDNGWEYRISYKAPDGSYKQKSKSGYRTKSEASAAALEAERLLNKNIFPDALPPKTLLRAAPTISPSTAEAVGFPPAPLP